MNATAGDPAPDAQALVDDTAGSRITARSSGPRLRTILVLARADAWLLSRSALALAGLLAGAAIIWVFGHTEQSVWWNVAWQIGYGQLFLGMAVLIAAQLAAGRSKRNGMADLYASFPTTAARRGFAQLLGLLGAVPASLLLIGGTAAVVEIAGVVGAPGSWSLVAGVLLVIAAGAVGIAIGSRWPHPLAGVLGALVIFIPFSQSNRLSGADIWLYPWMKPPQLDFLPGPLTGYPPVGAHAAELVGVAVLAGAIALVVTASGARAKGVLAIVGVLSLAATCVAGAAELRPIPTADVNQLVRAVADPVSAEHCTTVGNGRYCLYPDFGRELSPIEAPVAAVLIRLPVRPAQQLTVRQVAPLSPDLTLTHGHSDSQVSHWNAQLEGAPGNGGGVASAIYMPVSIRPADARFYLALSAGEWAVHFSTTVSNGNGPACVPVDQAREAIAIWLALLATDTSAGQLQSGLTGLHGQNWMPVSREGMVVPIWEYPGETLGDLSSYGLQPSAAGYLLASAMANLSEQKVEQVLKSAWTEWVNGNTTDSQLATALGIRMPAVPQYAGPALPSGAPSSAACAA